MTIWVEMIEHGFLAAMLALMGLEVVVLGYFAYRISRVLARGSGLTIQHLSRPPTPS